MILNQFTDLSDPALLEFVNELQGIAEKRSYKKNELAHEEGKVCDHLFFIEKGIARTFYFKDGKDITAHFATENGSITAIDSFIQRKRSKYSLEVLEDTEMLLLSYPRLQELLDQKPQYEKFVRLFLEQIYVDLAQRIENLLFYTAKERYELLIEAFPDLLQRVNLGHIASYIGISQETLSRIRGN